MTRALVLYAHPVEESFCSVLHRRTVRTLRDRGWEVDDCDLYAEGFSPLLTAEERRGYHEVATNTSPVQDYVDRLRAAEALILVFPVWNFGYPAILKGFFDRVFLPGVSLEIVNGKVQGCLHNIQKLGVVTTYGGSRMRALLCGDPPRKVVTRAVRAVVHPKAKMRYLALYDMNRADDTRRRGFHKRVMEEMREF